jgi:hypothetical protein
VTGGRSAAGAIFFLIAAASPAPPAAAAQADARPDTTAVRCAPGGLDALAGRWEGEGELFGRGATFAMRWERTLDGRFMELSFQNALLQPGGDASIVLRATALYRTSAPHRGVWVDTRGEILELSAEAGDGTLVTRWASQTEEGRTTYRLLGPDRLETVDEVFAEGEARVFGRAVYRRVGGADPG